MTGKGRGHKLIEDYDECCQAWQTPWPKGQSYTARSAAMRTALAEQLVAICDALDRIEEQ